MTLDDLDSDLAAMRAFLNEVDSRSPNAPYLALQVLTGGLRVHWRHTTACGDDPEEHPGECPRRVP